MRVGVEVEVMRVGCENGVRKRRGIVIGGGYIGGREEEGGRGREGKERGEREEEEEERGREGREGGSNWSVCTILCINKNTLICSYWKGSTNLSVSVTKILLKLFGCLNFSFVEQIL